jgi:hypothetical protein
MSTLIPEVSQIECTSYTAVLRVRIRWTVGRAANNKLGRIWKEAVVA